MTFGCRGRRLLLRTPARSVRGPSNCFDVIRRTATGFFALICAAVCAIALAAPAGAVVVGIGDGNPATFSDPRFLRLNIHEARLTVRWDEAITRRPGQRQLTQRDDGTLLARRDPRRRAGRPAARPEPGGRAAEGRRGVPAIAAAPVPARHPQLPPRMAGGRQTRVALRSDRAEQPGPARVL